MYRLLFSILLITLYSSTLAQPIISIQENSTNIVENTTYDFGTIQKNSFVDVEFTIVNSAVDDTLVIDDITISPNTYFTVFTPPVTDSIKGIGSLAFIVRLTTDCDETVKNASIAITSDDPANSSFDFDLEANINTISESASAGNDETICDTLYSLDANTPNSLSGQWSVAAGNGTFNDFTNPNTQVKDLAVGVNTFTWGLYDNGCLVDEDEVTIIRDAYPGPVNAGNDEKICATQSVSLFATTPTIGTGAWSRVDNAAILGDENAAITSVTNLETDTNTFVWTVTDGSSTCNPISDTVLIIRDENPTQADAGTDKNICVNSLKLDANTPVVGTGTWSVLSGSGTFQNVNSDSSLVSGFTLGSNEYRWTIRSTYDVCLPSRDQVIITRDTEPTIVDAGLDRTICEDTVSLNASPPDVGVGQWIVASGSSTVLEPMNPTSKVENLDNGTNTFIWVVTSGSCTSSPDAVIIDRDDDLTPADAGEDQFLCKDSSTVMTANTPVKGFGQWTQITGTSDIINLTNEGTEIKELTIGKNTFVWTISSGTCTPSSDTIDVWRDGVAPEINCPKDTVISNEPGLCGATFDYTTPVGTDNCPDAVTTQTSGLASGMEYPVGVTTNTFEVVDFYNFTATCSFEVTVIDTTLPVIACIDTIKQNNSLNDCGKVVTFSVPAGTDNCSGFSTTQTGGIGYTSGSFYPIGNTTLAYTVTDASGNMSTCQTVVAVSDAQNPTIDCPNGISQDLTIGNCDALITYQDPTIDDNCVNPDLTLTQTSGLTSGSNFPSGVTTNTFVVTDSSGNTASCSFDVTINDIETPEITCPGDLAVSNTTGSCEATVSYPDPAVNDICNNSTINLVQGFASDESFPVGTTTVEYEVEDAAGNTDACSFNITVTDDENPTINCPNNITEAVTAGMCEAPVTYNAPIGADNCTGFTTNQTDGTGLSSGSNFPVGTTTLSYEITDASLNKAQCSFDITIVDNEDPTIVCPSDINVDADPGVCETQVLFTAPTGADNCSVSNTFQSDATGLTSGSNFPVGLTTLEYTAEDVEGNTASCSFNIIVKDMEGPAITCPNDTSVYVAAGFCSKNVNYFDPIVTDLCGPASFSLKNGQPKGSAFSLGEHDITYQAIDTAGNTSSCTFSIIVKDTIKPLITCEPDQNLFTSPGSCTANFTFGLPAASDNCDSVRVVQVEGPVSGSNFPLGTTELAFVAYDSTGNQSDTCKYTVTVQDNEQPTIACPADINTTADAGLCSTQVTYTLPVGTDNCTIANTTQSDASGLTNGDVFPVGLTTLSYTTEDASGNTASCSFDIIVKDLEAPAITCPNDTIVYVNAGLCSKNVNYFDPVVNDLCGPATFSLNSGKTKGAAFNLGEHDIQYLVEDTAGNTATCTFTVTVLDTIAPTIVCGSDEEIFTTTGSCTATYNFSLPAAADNCDSVRVEQVEGPVSGSNFPLGTTELAFVAYDSTGNQSDTCKITITVTDRENPVISCPSAITMCTEGVVNFTTPTASDNCSSGIVVNQTSGPASGTSLTAGSYVASFEGTDDYGNTGTCSIPIEVYDNTFLPDAGIDFNVCPTDTLVIGNIPARPEILSWSTTSGTAVVSTPLSSTTAITNLVNIETYEFIYTFDRGACGISRDTIEVSKNSLPGPALAPADTVLCDINILTLSASIPTVGTGTWSVATGSGSVATLSTTEGLFSSLSGGLNKVVWTVDNGLCPVETDTVYITVASNPVIDIAQPEDILFGESIQFDLTGSSIYSYEWEPANAFENPFLQNPLGTFEESTIVKATATTANGCSVTDSVEVTVLNELYIYTGFTPNGDLVNDEWTIKGIQAYPDAKIEVYSQWGQPVYSSLGYEEPWNGKKDGKNLPFGPYYYVIELGNGERKNGTVTILR